MKLLNAQVLLATYMCIATLARRGYAQADTNQGKTQTRTCIAAWVSNLYFISLSPNPGSTVHLYGGDIVLTPEQQATLEATSNPNDPFAPQNAVVRNTRSLWPSGMVPYVLDSSLSKWQQNVQSTRTARTKARIVKSLSFKLADRLFCLLQVVIINRFCSSFAAQSARTAIQNAMNEYTTRTCIRFAQRTTESDYVRFFRGNGYVTLLLQ